MKEAQMKLLLSVLFAVLSFFSIGQEERKFNSVERLVYAKDNQIYLVTDNGTWQVHKDTLERIDGAVAETTTVTAHEDILSPYSLKPNIWQNLTGLGYVILLLLFAVLYLYYQSALNRRRRAFYERIKVQQQVLSIAFLATGDEVLDCDLKSKQVTRINQNAQLNLGEEVYFQSEKFISQLHPEDSSVFIGHFESLLSGGKNNYEITYRVADEDGNWIWIVERGCVIERDSTGIATRLVASMRDISEIKHDQEQLIRLVNELELRLKRAEAATMRS
jgi:PAS domain-containing protein